MTRNPFVLRGEDSPLAGITYSPSFIDFHKTTLEQPSTY